MAALEEGGPRFRLWPLPGPGLTSPPPTLTLIRRRPVLTFINTGSVKGLINFLLEWGDNEF